ncbi:DUF6113 family protein [Microbacterium sp. LRZ72]|uniref:DUF6113 family protein n=1 Tax=Microbacterium sp. LRZ72 TaxID=2942481 RepID=UPI0029A2264A|nr:DUF6113 family protein [Microbacterium sp. LRZ72]MDX2375763.1 DUF6113 family protein [Microbacterium sp. LRZ72]
MRNGLGTRIAMAVIAALAGAVYGVVGTVTHGATWWVIPVGLVLALVGALAFLVAVRSLTDRWTSAAAGTGLVIAVVVLSGEGPGGSVLAPAGLEAVIWTVGAPLLAVLVVAWPTLPAATLQGRRRN